MNILKRQWWYARRKRCLVPASRPAAGEKRHMLGMKPKATPMICAKRVVLDYARARRKYASRSILSANVHQGTSWIIF